MAQKARIEEYADGNVTIYNLRNNMGVPVFGLNEMISASRVTQYWDGTPMDESKVDNQLYLQLKELPDDTNTDLEKYIGNYFKVNLPNEGELFLEKDTMAEMRGLNSTEILLLQMGYYKGVKLNGYYSKGDTPNPIEYLLSSSSTSDNGGSIIELPSGLKLEHKFGTIVNMKYYGVVGDNVADDSDAFQKAMDSSRNCILRIPRGVYKITKRLTIPANWQVVMEGEGRASRRGADFSSGDGLVKLVWEGPAEEGSVFYFPSVGYFDGAIKNIYILNRGESRGLDGILIEGRFTVTNLDNITISGFRNGIRIVESFYYTEFNKCLFHNNDVGVRAESYGSSQDALANGATFQHCQLSHNRVGFRGRSNGEIINFFNCYVENNTQWGFELEGTKVVNIENSYIEFNGEDEQYTSSQRGFFYLSTSRGPGRNTQPITVNLLKNFFFGRGTNTFCSIVPASSTRLHINLDMNNFQANQWDGATLFRFPNSSYPQYASISMRGNINNPEEVTDANIAFSNYNSSALRYIDVSNDSFIEKVFPYLTNNGTKNEVVGPNNVSGNSPNRDVAATKNLNFPFAETANAVYNIFNNTNTTGNKLVNLYQGDGSNNVTIRLNAGTGYVDAQYYRFSGVNRVIESGGADPVNNVSRTVGSLYLRSSAGNERPYYKTGSGDENWKPLAFLDEIVQNQSESISNITTPDATDEASAVTLANANKAKINELLTKFRAAGLIGS